MTKTKRYLLEIIGIAISLAWLFPFYIMLINSFKTKKELFKNTITLPSSLNFSNYSKAIDALDLKVTLFNSTVITLCSIVIILVFSALAAYALQRTKTRASKIIFYVFVASMLIPFQSVMIPLVSFMHGIHLTESRIGIMIMYLGFGSSMAMFLVHGALGSIPTALDEAAKIDGCNPLQTFFVIILPMLKPILVTVAVLDAIWIWNDYLLPSLVINKDNLLTIPLKMYNFFGEYTKQWHLALAGLTVAIIPVIIFYFVAQKQIIQGITDGAVK